jgi:hypothetical protein
MNVIPLHPKTYEVWELTEEWVTVVATFDNREQAMAAGVNLPTFNRVVVVCYEAGDYETVWDSRQGWTKPK